MEKIKNLVKGLLGAFLFCTLGATVTAQTVTVQSTPYPGEYQYKTTQLNARDKVVYRFADGHFIEQFASSNNINASITRSGLGTTPLKAVAYVARKNGPLGYASSSSNQLTTTCLSCTSPQSVGLSAGNISLYPLWAHPENNDQCPPFVDQSTTPVFYSPNQPWHILVVSAVGSASSDRIEFDIPEGLTYEGVIIKNKWKTGVGSVSDNQVYQVSAPSPQTRSFNLSSNSINNQVNLYIVLSGHLRINSRIPYFSRLINKNGTIAASVNRIEYVKKHPHDPNFLTVFNEYGCTNDAQPDPIHFRVEFQNEGAGIAEFVQVNLPIPVEVMDVNEVSITESSVNPSDITTISGDGEVIFQFNNINLPGTAQLPTPEIASTKGWIEFSVGMIPCSKAELEYTFQALVTFVGGGGPYPLQEITLTNEQPIKLVPCSNETINMGCDIKQDDGDIKNRTFSNTFEPSSIKCYPTLFQDHINMEGLDLEASPRYHLFDLGGRCWMEGVLHASTLYTDQLPAGAYFLRIDDGKSPAIFKLIKP